MEKTGREARVWHKPERRRGERSGRDECGFGRKEGGGEECCCVPGTENMVGARGKNVECGGRSKRGEERK